MSRMIVPATIETLRQIEVWLTAEDAAHDKAVADLTDRWPTDVDIPSKGFLCNWNIVKDSWARDAANVHVLLVDDEPVGFVDELDILEVRPDLRGLGYGRELANFMVGWAETRGHSVVEIEIAPETAIPFWKAMGFTVVPDRKGGGGGTYAFRRLRPAIALGDGEPVSYRVFFYPEERNWSVDTKPFEEFEGLGERTACGSVQLPERAYCFSPHEEHLSDCVARIEVDGAVIFEDKVKREAAKALGLRPDPGGIYAVDRIDLQ